MPIEMRGCNRCIGRDEHVGSICCVRPGGGPALRGRWWRCSSMRTQLTHAHAQPLEIDLAPGQPAARARSGLDGTTKKQRGSTMKFESFIIASRLHRLLIVGLALSMLGVAINSFAFVVNPGWPPGLSLVISIALLVGLAVWWRNRSRPPLEITEEEIRYAPLTWRRPRSIPLREIESIEFSGERRAVVRLRSGGRLVVRLGNIEASSRTRAVSALKEVVRAVTRPA